MKANALVKWGIVGVLLASWAASAAVLTNVYITLTPDYHWKYGCMGTASGNLMGYWDAHGFPDFYTGPVNGGVAPTFDTPGSANDQIRGMWASQAGENGRPPGGFNHVEDYYGGYDSTVPDPYVTAHRAEHIPNCIGDFIGLNQLKWTNMNNECDGNRDIFAFNWYDHSGDSVTNFVPPMNNGTPCQDVQSGLRAWTQWRGYDCMTFSQLVSFNPDITPAGTGKGFTFANLQAEIDHGYPFIVQLQAYGQFSITWSGDNGTLPTLTHVNPEIHGMLVYGYYTDTAGGQYMIYRTSWATGGSQKDLWKASTVPPAVSPVYTPNAPGSTGGGLPTHIRGVICYHPLPKLRKYTVANQNLTLQWDGPAGYIWRGATTGVTSPIHGYVVEKATSLAAEDFAAVSSVLTTNIFTVTNCPSPAFLRVRMTYL